jgi:hypothetical protein
MAVIDTETITLRCSCCNLPYAEVKNGVLVIVSRHSGDRHINALALADVERLLKQTATRQT